MDYQAIISGIDAEIAKLTQIRGLLAQNGRVNALIGSKQVKKAIVKQATKRVMSPDARARIAAAQKKRWAKSKRAAKKAAAAGTVPAE